MPATSKAVNPKGIEVVFTEADHSYRSVINGTEIKYVSGTSFLHKFFPVFDPDGSIAVRCAKKENITVEELRKRWDDKKNESCLYGTRVHETVEDTIHGREYRNTPRNMKEELAFAKAKEIGNILKNKIDVLGVEKIVFDHRLRIAGTIDLLGQSRKTGEYLIIDHKTNEEIVTENKWNSFCLDPIKHIPDTNFHHYALQLSLYSYLMKRVGYVDRNAKFKLYLNHITQTSWKLIEVPNYENEIKELVIDYLLGKSRLSLL